MPKKRPSYEILDLPKTDDPMEILARMDRFIAGVEKHRAELSVITDEHLLKLKRDADKLRHDIEVCKAANETLRKAREAEAKSRAAYELELERHVTRQAQVDVGKALGAKKPRFQD